jgi:AcrR family transcriptional regulator
VELTSPDTQRKARKSRRHARQRQALLDAARGVLAEEGLPGFTIARVAAAAEVSKPSFYYYFRSREALVAALADTIAADEASCMSQAAYAAAEGPDALSAALRAVVTWHTEDLDRYRLLYQWPAVVGVVDGFYDDVVAPRRTQSLAVLASRLGPRPDADQLAETALATAHGIVATAANLQALGQDPAPRLAAQLDVACRALVAVLR